MLMFHDPPYRHSVEGYDFRVMTRLQDRILATPAIQKECDRELPMHENGLLKACWLMAAPAKRHAGTKVHSPRRL